MSKTSMRERNKAIRKAWEREQQLVQEGKGTRDWTKEQQADILDPDKGKAYDDQGRAFEGQHMKSAAEYPEYQGDPDNIQFLTKDEHLAAHKGSWQNPTNWYYDPETKVFTDFGDGGPVPCSIIELSDPVFVPESVGQKDPEEKEENARDENSDNGTHTSRESTDNAPPRSEEKRPSSSIEGEAIHPEKHINYKASKGSVFLKGLKKVGSFIVEHPVESLEIAGVVIGGGLKIVSSIRGSGSRGNSTHQTSPGTGESSSVTSNTDIGAAIADIVEKANRATPHENDVPGHRQRYHTKDGVVWRDKAPYHRGGKSDS